MNIVSKRFLIKLLVGRFVYFFLGFFVCYFIFPLHKNNFEKQEEAFNAGINYLHGCVWAVTYLHNSNPINRGISVSKSKVLDENINNICFQMSENISANYLFIANQMDHLESIKNK